MTSAARNGKGKAAYKRKREALKRRVARDGLTCVFCGEPFDLTLPRGHRMSFTADHAQPLARGGHLVNNELRPSHLHCNSRRGDHTDPEVWAAT
ncbi:HNH endonuclease [Microbacterium sp.]|jgi:5-methylcytosine-specific restriction endonuclease McrA|uniref:HNH endonuclease n=1 Tax=Microbacterium sp. TaxID=51671 RepID=UPI0037C974F7